MFAVYGDYIHAFFFGEFHYRFTARNERFFICERDRLACVYRFERRGKPRKPAYSDEYHVAIGSDSVSECVFARIKIYARRQLLNSDSLPGVGKSDRIGAQFRYLL